MMTDSEPRCELKLTSRDLSTWRAQGFSAAEATRISAHAPACAACQIHLAAYDAMDTVLRAQPVPVPVPVPTWPASNWATPSWPHRWRTLSVTLDLARSPATSARRLWKGLVAVAAVLLVALAFTQLLGHRATSRGSSPIVLTRVSLTPQPPARIAGTTWERIAAPMGADWLRFYASTPNDPSTLFACGVPPTSQTSGVARLGTIALWRTHDAGQHWTRAALPDITGWVCEVRISPDAPEHIALLVEHVSPPHVLCADYSILLSADGGETWQPVISVFSPVSQPMYVCNHELWVTGDHLFISSSYVERPGVGTRDAQGSAVIARSDDNGRTWERVDMTALGAFTLPTQLADGKSMLVIGPDITQRQLENMLLWQTRDAGRSWQPIALIQGYEAATVLAASGIQTTVPSVDHPLYLLHAPFTPWYLFYLQIAQVSDSQHYALLPPLPVAGATASRLGITSVLGETPSGKLLVLGVGPRERMPAVAAKPAPGELDRQWLWEWDPRLTRWTTFSAPLPEPWPNLSPSSPGCSDHCWQSFFSQGSAGASTYLWVGSLYGAIYRLRLPAQAG